MSSTFTDTLIGALCCAINATRFTAAVSSSAATLTVVLVSFGRSCR